MADDRESILTSCAHWLDQHGYQIAGKWKDPYTTGEKLAAKAAAFAAKKIMTTILGTTPGVRCSVQAGGNSEKLAKAMAPYNESSDLVAVHFSGMLRNTNRILIFLFDNQFHPESAHTQFQSFMKFASPVGNLGLRVNHNHVGMHVHPVVMVSESAKFKKIHEAVTSHGSDYWIWKKVSLRAATVDLSNALIRWAPRAKLPLIASNEGPLSDNDIKEMCRP